MFSEDVSLASFYKWHSVTTLTTQFVVLAFPQVSAVLKSERALGDDGVSVVFPVAAHPLF